MNCFNRPENLKIGKQEKAKYQSTRVNQLCFFSSGGGGVVWRSEVGVEIEVRVKVGRAGKSMDSINFNPKIFGMFITLYHF